MKKGGNKECGLDLLKFIFESIIKEGEEGIFSLNSPGFFFNFTERISYYFKFSHYKSENTWLLSSFK